MAPGPGWLFLPPKVQSGDTLRALKGDRESWGRGKPEAGETQKGLTPGGCALGCSLYAPTLWSQDPTEGRPVLSTAEELQLQQGPLGLAETWASPYTVLPELLAAGP